MNFFHGITWLNNGHFPECRDWTVRQFRQKHGLTYVHDGDFEFRFRGGPVRRVKPPVAFLYYPGPRYEYGVTDARRTWNNRFINFTGPRVALYAQKGLFPMRRSPPLVPVHQPERFCAAFDDLREYVNRPYHQDDVATHKLEGLLLLLHEQESVPADTTPHVRAIQQLCNDMERNPAAPWDFVVEARRLQLSYSHFRKVFRTAVGQSPQQLLIQFRLRRAAQMLLHTRRTLADIAAQVGIRDPHYFIRAFKARHRLTPGRYRRDLA